MFNQATPMMKPQGNLFGIPTQMRGASPVRDMPIDPMQMRRMMQAGSGMQQRGNPSFRGGMVNTMPTMNATPMQMGVPMDKMKMQMMVSQLLGAGKQF